MDAVRDQAIEVENGRLGVDWAQRRADLDERIMNSSEKMIDRLNQILDSPLYEKRRVTKTETSADGKTIISITHVHPAKWAFGTAAQFLAIAKEAVAEVARRHMGTAGEYGDASGEVERKFLQMIDDADREERGGGDPKTD